MSEGWNKHQKQTFTESQAYPYNKKVNIERINGRVKSGERLNVNNLIVRAQLQAAGVES